MTVLSQEQRAASLEAMTSQKFDVLVIGGGVTGVRFMKKPSRLLKS